MTTLTLSPVGRRALPRERPPHSTFAVAALGLAVLAAVAIAIALAIPNLPEIGTIYATRDLIDRSRRRISIGGQGPASREMS